MQEKTGDGIVRPDVDVRAAAAIRGGVLGAIGLAGRYELVCRDRHGREKWRESIDNLVTNAGEDYLLDAGLAGGAQITSWFLGLIDGTPTVDEADTAASHVGWAEVTAYTEGTRPAFTAGAVSGQSVDNAASKGSFSINANGTVIGGAFLISNSTKGGATGTLYSAGAFTGGNKTLDSGDTLEVQATYTAGGA